MTKRFGLGKRRNISVSQPQFAIVYRRITLRNLAPIVA